MWDLLFGGWGLGIGSRSRDVQRYVVGWSGLLGWDGIMVYTDGCANLQCGNMRGGVVLILLLFSVPRDKVQSWLWGVGRVVLVVGWNA